MRFHKLASILAVAALSTLAAKDKFDRLWNSRPQRSRHGKHNGYCKGAFGKCKNRPN